jgi:hypothetical protein
MIDLWFARLAKIYFPWKKWIFFCFFVFIFMKGNINMDDNNKKKFNKNLKILFIVLGAGLVAAFSLIFGFLTLESAIWVVAGTTIGAVIARIVSK